jgi:enediyne biosynthesis protein E4
MGSRAALPAAAVLAIGVGSAVTSHSAAPWPVSLVDVGREAGLVQPSVYGGVERKRFIIETNSAGAALVDVDGDGRLDALIQSGTRLRDGSREDARYPEGTAPVTRLYRNLGGGRFADVSAGSSLDRVGWATSVCAGDYNGDGRVDLFFTYYGHNVLYVNLGGGRFADVTAATGLGSEAERWGAGCSFLDYDRDGDLDLFVGNYLVFDRATVPDPGQAPNCSWKGVPVACGPKGLPHETNLLYRNDSGRFRDVSTLSGVAAVRGRYSMTVVSADLDEDGWVDIYVASDSTAAILYRNNRDGTFTDVAIESGTAYSEFGVEQAGMGVAVGDFDRDGRVDLLKTHFADDIPALYRNLGRGLFQDVAMAAGLGVENRYVQWGTGMPDLDNDGWPDLVFLTGSVYPEVESHLPRYAHKGPCLVFRNRSDGRFEDVTPSSGPGPLVPRSSRGAAFGDIDDDGDMDILVMNMNEAPALLRNDHPGGRSWLQVELEGRGANRLGLGATVVVTAGGRRQAGVVLSQSSYGSVDDLRLHFGLGEAEAAEAVEVRWPSGERDVLRNVRGRRRVRIREGESPAGPDQLALALRQTGAASDAAAHFAEARRLVPYLQHPIE